MSNNFKETVSELIERLSNLDNELETLREDRKELFKEFKERLDTGAFKAALQIYKIRNKTNDQHTLEEVLNILDTAV
jgi:uncharacterized protein (UPF0335 family)